MELKYLQQITAELNLSLKQVNNIVALQEEGATIPFIARYRKEATGNHDEVQIGAVIEKVKYFTELTKRKETILKTIEEAGKLTPELKKRIEDCIDATVLEDIYLPYKPKRKTRATVAIEKGLEPLAKIIFEQKEGAPDALAEQYINDKVASTDEALKGARDIIAEWINENAEVRDKLRKLFTHTAVLSSKVIEGKEEEGNKYKDYFDFKEPLTSLPSHRVLAVLRAESEGILYGSIQPEEEDAV